MSNAILNLNSAEDAERLAEAVPRVFHLIGSFDMGGSEQQAVQLAGALRRNGRYSICLASLQPHGVLRQQAEQLGLGDIPSYALSSFYDRNFLEQLRLCSAHLRRLGTAVVHTHEFYSNIFGMLAASLAGIPVRIASRRDLGTLRSRTQNWAERTAYRLAHAVVVNSAAVHLQLVRVGVPAHKIFLIYNGINLKRSTSAPLSRSEALSRLRLPPQQGPLVSLVANFRHALKDQPTFLKAAKEVSQAMPAARFVLAGEGELLVPVQALAVELGIADKVCFLGRCDHVAELLSVSTVCVLSSRSEGFSNAILEYMAAARPVVATDVGGARECLTEGETGYLVSPGDYRTMSARILSLLLDPSRALAMGQRGREVVEERFSQQTQLKRTEQLYSQLLARSRRPRPRGAQLILNRLRRC